ncbi:12S seed storage protein CRD-like [Cornus florida]|uniref:12S seed storage protein CRD-like n=1 Tax=Cornus florida TaxID=4283 RepID=UPI0028A2D371|nr:12S seed storage protein CRD-like [Cornus florida]
MALSLVPQMADEKVFEGEGGSYHSWSPSNFPLLGEAKVGAGVLMLHPRGFALPHYADSSKIAFVLQGTCTVGMASPNTSEETVVMVKNGDAFPVEIGVVSWWFNGGDTDMVIVFLGETSKAHTPGSFTYFFLTGTLGILGGFSPEFVSKAYDLNEEETKNLVKSQAGSLIVKLKEGIAMPKPCKNASDGKLVFGFENASPDVKVKNGGLVTTMTAARLPLLGKVGLSANVVKLDADAMSSPMYTTDSSVQLTYIVKGSGRVQIVGINGQGALDAKVEAGHLFVVPRFFPVTHVADGEGMEFFSVITSPEPVFEKLAGNTSVWKAIAPVVLEAALDETPEFVKLFKSKIKKSTVLIPPGN